MDDFDFGLGEDIDTLRATVEKFSRERIAASVARLESERDQVKELGLI